MKNIVALSFALFSAHASADMVITLKDGVKEVPQSLMRTLSGQNYTIKPAWNEPRLTPQSLPKDVWQRAQRNPAMAILLRGEMTLESKLPEGVERI